MRHAESGWVCAGVAALCAALLGPWLAAGTAAAQPLPEAMAAAVRAVLPAVVSITVPREPGDAEPPADEGAASELLRGLFGELLESRPQTAVAAGVILDPEGLVLTAAHAVSDAADLAAIAADGARYKAVLVGADRKTDLAVVRLVGPGPFPCAVFGDSDSARVGDWVAAVGAPYGLGATVTAGIISATARPRAMSAVDDLLQTDAVTFPDSAGGPLLDARGRVVGVTTILTGQDFGISFAMPANAARRVFAQLAREGRVARGTLDARVQRLTPGLVRAFSIPELSGVIVSEVSARGAAATAGLRAGDVLVALEGKPLDSPYAVERALRDSRPGQVASVTYWRKGQVQVSPMKLGRESDEAPAPPFSSPIAIRLQFEVRAITPELGVVVAHVRRSGAPAEARVRAGDVIRELNGQPVRTIADFERLARAVKPGEWVGLLVQRGRVPVYVAVEARQD